MLRELGDCKDKTRSKNSSMFVTSCEPPSCRDRLAGRETRGVFNLMTPQSETSISWSATPLGSCEDLFSVGVSTAYVFRMIGALQSVIPVTYVRDIGDSRAFYGLLGFEEYMAGASPTSAWCSLYHGSHSVLLVSTKPRLAVPRLPLLFYFFFTDLTATCDRLGAAGVQVTHCGYPSHAHGGEVKVLDPDGNTILLGQREASPSQPPVLADDSPHFSILREAAALVAARGGTNEVCQVRQRDREAEPCQAKAEVKLADSTGNCAWACLQHADELLITVPGAFIASTDDGQGFARYLSP
jgi:catechol 2,3-dioxygenase-like lactoylglutathione lyase family enzyme